MKHISEVLVVVLSKLMDNNQSVVSTSSISKEELFYNNSVQNIIASWGQIEDPLWLPF